MSSILEMLEIKNFDEISFLKDLIYLSSNKKTIVPKLKQKQMESLKGIRIYERDFKVRLKTLSRIY